MFINELAERVGFVPDDLAPINGLDALLPLQVSVQIPIGLQPHGESRDSRARPYSA
jgi:hypothetical protein